METIKKETQLDPVKVCDGGDKELSLYEKVYSDVVKKAEQLALEELGSLEMLGTCHVVWYYMKKIFLEEYGLVWHSPAELQPKVFLD